MNTRIKSIAIIALLFWGTFFVSCQDEIVETRKFKVNVPIYKSIDEIRKSVQITSGEELKNPGKIYFYRHYLFINERNKGIHIYDNKNPKAPVYLKFIEIPGNVDIAVKGKRLYADSYIDLLVFNIQDIENIYEENRLKEVLPYYLPEYDRNSICEGVDNTKGLVVGWKVEEKSEEYIRNPNRRWWGGGFLKNDMLTDGAFRTTEQAQASEVPTGKGGSMARFKIYKNYLYIAMNSQLNVFNITDLNNPIKGEKIYTTLNVETVFIAKDKLFIGATTGMGIYDLATPEKPTFISIFSHANSCDPVVVDEKYAYVTLRSGNRCQNVSNQLDVIDISDLQNPQLIKTYSMSNPHGLGIDENILFICDGDAGLKIYDKTDPYGINQNMIKHYKKINAYDVIPLKGTLMMIGKDGFYQYDYSDIDNIKLLSQIKISR